MNLQANHIESLTEHKTLKMDGYDIHYYVSGKENTDLIVFYTLHFQTTGPLPDKLISFLKNIG